MPNILKLWQAGELGRGTIIEVPIDARKFTLPNVITGSGDYEISTNDVIKAPDGRVPLTKCRCVSTGNVEENENLILIGEILPIPITLTAFVGTINGSMAVNLACSVLLSRPNQLISAKCINERQYEMYREFAPSGEYDNKAFWIDGYSSSCGMVGKSISCGMFYAIGRVGDFCRAAMCEIIGGGDNDEEMIKFGETYENLLIMPTFSLNVWNHALELKNENGVWVIER